jgi:hypothetical protein
MSSHEHVPAVEPEDLERLFVERVNAGDVDGRYDLKLWIGSGDGSAAYLPG